MHLLAAQPGGFVDDEGIIDLNQTPADMIILSAADSSLAALSDAVCLFAGEQIDGEGEDQPSVRLANWMQLLKPAAYDLYEHKVLEQSKVVVLSLLGGASYWQYGFVRLQAWAAADRKRTLIIVPGDDTPDPELFAASSVTDHEAMRIWRYLREGGVDNSLHLLNCLTDQYLQQARLWHEPRPLPKCMIYLPASSAGQPPGGLQAATFAEWKQRQNHTDKPVALLLFYRSHLQSGNTRMFDQLIEQLEKHGLAPLPIAIASLKDAESLTLVNALLQQSGASLIINSTGFASNTVASPDLCSQPSEFYSPFVRKVPVLQLVLSSSTEEDWQTHVQGLRSRDIAMQVVLPEMDGRVHTRALSFKTEDHFDDRSQVSVVRYQLHQERAGFVARLALRFAQLANKPNREKRIALILANYPTKDGRIGNGVGLDTPYSALIPSS